MLQNRKMTNNDLDLLTSPLGLNIYQHLTYQKISIQNNQVS